VNNLARPGGNITGFSIVAPELGTKRLELLKEIVPNMSSIAVLSNPKNPQQKIEMKEVQTAAQAMGLHLHSAEVSTEGELEDAFVAMNKAGVQALILLTDSIFFSQRKRTVDLASNYKLPAMYFFQVFVEEGGLMSYGPSDADLFRRAAGYVDRILKGAKPGDAHQVRTNYQPQGRQRARSDYSADSARTRRPVDRQLMQRMSPLLAQSRHP